MICMGILKPNLPRPQNTLTFDFPRIEYARLSGTFLTQEGHAAGKSFSYRSKIHLSISRPQSVDLRFETVPEVSGRGGNYEPATARHPAVVSRCGLRVGAQLTCGRSGRAGKGSARAGRATGAACGGTGGQTRSVCHAPPLRRREDNSSKIRTAGSDRVYR